MPMLFCLYEPNYGSVLTDQATAVGGGRGDDLSEGFSIAYPIGSHCSLREDMEMRVYGCRVSLLVVLKEREEGSVGL